LMWQVLKKWWSVTAGKGPGSLRIKFLG
jgi:hypothetical protein